MSMLCNTIVPLVLYEIVCYYFAITAITQVSE